MARHLSASPQFGAARSRSCSVSIRRSYPLTDRGHQAGNRPLKTLVHELAHALLPSDDRPQRWETADVEVESVAYIVCAALGLDTGKYSFAYVTRWSDGVSDQITTAERPWSEWRARRSKTSHLSGPYPGLQVELMGTTVTCR